MSQDAKVTAVEKQRIDSLKCSALRMAIDSHSCERGDMLNNSPDMVVKRADEFYKFLSA